MPGVAPLLGRPGIGTVTTGTHNFVARDGSLLYYPGGGTIEGTKARDVGNSADSLLLLRVGKLMGKITSGGYYANSVIGASAGAITGASTTLLSSAAIATELNRRIGATGTFKLTGPPTAAGVVRSLTVTYSALNLTTGDITMTALGVNQVEDIKFNLASTAGNLQLTVQKTDGTFVTTGNAAWNGTDATYLGNINTALDAATGVAGGIVASAIPATDPDLGIRLTYSGTGYAGLPWTRAQVALFPTTSTVAVYVPVTTAVDGRFVTASWIQPTDGSETPITFVADGYGILIPDDSSDVPFPRIPIGGILDASRLIDYPADASLRTYLKACLSTASGGKFIFDQF